MQFFQPAFATGMLRYVRTLLRLKVSEEEMAMFTGTLLLCPQRPSLADPELVNNMHCSVAEAFQYHVRTAISYCYALCFISSCLCSGQWKVSRKRQTKDGIVLKLIWLL